MKRFALYVFLIALGASSTLAVQHFRVQPVSAVGFTLNGTPYGAVITTSDGDTNFYEPSDPKLSAIVAKLPPASRGVLNVTSPACTRPQVY